MVIIDGELDLVLEEIIIGVPKQYSREKSLK